MIDDLRRLPKPLLYLYGGTIITRMGAFVFPYLTIYLSESRSFGFDQVGMILSTGSVGLLTGNLLGGWMADRLSRKWTLVFALMINAVGFAGLAFRYDSGWAYALLLLVGYFGSGMYNPAANTLIADLTNESNRPFAYTVNYVCVNLGMAIGPLVGGLLATIDYAWIFVGDVISSIACAILIAIGIRPLPLSPLVARTKKPQAGQPRTKQPLLVWFRHPLVLAFCLAYFFLICPLMGLEYAVPILVKNVFSQSLGYVGIIYTINAVCILSLSFFIEKAIRHRTHIQSMIVAGVFWSLGLSILLFGYSVSSLIACTFVWSIGEIVASITVPTFIADRVDAEVKGRFLALNDVVRSLAGVVCPIGLGMTWTHFGPRTSVSVLAVMPFIAIAVYFTIGAIEQTRSTGEHHGLGQPTVNGKATT